MNRVYSLYRDPGLGVYIGRPGKHQAGPHGNPVALGKPCPVCKKVHFEPGGACACYEVHLRARLAADPDYARAFDALQGQDLACFCAPKGGLSAADPVRCHGQVILKILQERAGE